MKNIKGLLLTGNKTGQVLIHELLGLADQAVSVASIVTLAPNRF